MSRNADTKTNLSCIVPWVRYAYNSGSEGCCFHLFFAELENVMSTPDVRDNYFVEVRHRPRRLAFLLDVDESSEERFNEIADFNVSCWGGRYNPIIPLIEGKITEPYWRLLELIDPDILYTYHDLNIELIKRISTDLRPLDVLKRDPRFQSNRLQIDRQATVVPVMRRIMGQFPIWARKPEPAVLVFDDKDVPALSSFVKRNFGGNDHFSLWCRDHQIPSVALPPDDKEVLKALTSNRNLVVPVDICGEGPRKFKASTDDWSTALTLCYGDSSWNFVEYWNLSHFLGENRSVVKSLSEMWIKPSLLEDKTFFEVFIEFLRRRVFVSDHQHYLRLISYDASLKHMQDVTKKICEDFKWNLYPGEPIVRSKGELPVFEARPIIGLFVPRATQPRTEQASGKTSLLELKRPPDAPPQDSDEAWIAEFAVENPAQERYFANKTAWWKLPKKDHVASLFVRDSFCRVANDYFISAQVLGQQEGIILHTPELKSLFSMLVLPPGAPAWAQKLEPSLHSNPINTFYIRSSDKGMYTRGVLGLFESLQKAAYVFEHDFWRGVIESLSSPVASEHTRNKVRNDLSRLGWENINSPSAVDLLVDEVVDAAGRIQRPIHYISFGALLERYRAYIATLEKDDKFLEIGDVDPSRSETSDEKHVPELARANLRDMLSEMTARKLFLHGAEIQCDHCLASLWYHIDDLRSVVTCRGCRTQVNLPAEIPWSYALNELVVSAVRDHGVAPVIRTAFRLFERSRESFCFLPGIEIRDYSAKPECQICELDLVWIRDGEFGMAEVKRTPKKFAVGEKLRMILDIALPDRYLLVSTSGSTEQMEAIRTSIQAQVNRNISVVAWSPHEFASSSHPGWNTFLHSLFP